MEKLTLEQQKAYQRLEKFQDALLNQQQLSDGYRRKLSETTRPRYGKRTVQRSKTVELTTLQPNPSNYSPLRQVSKGSSFTFGDVQVRMRRTASLKGTPSATASTTSQSSLPSITSATSEQPQTACWPVSQEETTPQAPGWQTALAHRRKKKLSQLQVFREQGHWGEDSCEKANAMLSGCSFSPTSPISMVLSHAGEFLFKKEKEIEDIDE